MNFDNDVFFCLFVFRIHEPFLGVGEVNYTIVRNDTTFACIVYLYKHDKKAQ